MEYRKDIDGLRAMAVMLVVLFHLRISTFSGGFVGVDVFLVISGFLVTSLLVRSARENRLKLSVFYARRARRLFPALYVTTVFTLLAAVFILPPASLVKLAKSAIASVASVANIFFWLTRDYFDDTGHLEPLLHTWSLSVEEQFYLIWPLVILAIWRLGRGRTALAAFLGIAIIGGVAFSELMVRSSPNAAFYLLPFRVFEFAIGGIVGLIPQIRGRVLNSTLAVLGLAMILYAAVSYSKATVFPGVSALMPCMGAALVLYSIRQAYIQPLICAAPMVYLGKISYSLYLTHWPIIVLYGFYMAKPFAFEPAEQLGLLAASLLSAVFLHHLVERPFRIQPGQTVLAPSLSPAGVGVWVSSLVLTLGGVCGYIWNQDGLASRYDERPQIAQLLVSAERTRPGPVNKKHLPDNAPIVLLIGDSHAGDLRYGLELWASGNGIRVIHSNVAGCAPIFGVFTVPSEPGCDTKEAKYKALAGQADVVVMVARWGLYSTPFRMLPGNPVRLHRSLHTETGQKNDGNIERTQQLFTFGLNSTVELFRSHGANVLFVGQIPSIAQDPVSCIAAQSSAYEVEKNCNPVTRDMVEQEVRWSIEVARKINGLTVFDPTPLFCPSDMRKPCRITDQQLMLYRDSHHPSHHGASLMVERLAPLILELLEKE